MQFQTKQQVCDGFDSFRVFTLSVCLALLQEQWRLAQQFFLPFLYLHFAILTSTDVTENRSEGVFVR